MLEQKIKMLEESATFPRENENALKGRGFLNPSGTSTAGATVSIGSFPFNLPANPSGTLTVSYKGKIYNLLYK